VSGSPADAVAHYSAHAAAFAEQYERILSADVHAPFADLIATGPGLVLDVGAGSGRDAAWLARQGHEVVAVEPAEGMRWEGAARHHGLGIRWIDDRLPDLTAVHRLGLAFETVLVNAVWMHVVPTERARAFRKLVTLLKPGGLLIVTLRHGPADPERPMWPATSGEIEALARSHGLSVARITTSDDSQDRAGISWTSVCLRLPDDGGGGLPLLRGIILNDNKSSTYKLALLRSIARIADGAPALAVECTDEDAVQLPIGLVALNWVRMYLPLVAASLPQAPGNAGHEGLGFAKVGFRSLMPLGVVAQDLRVGAQFTGERARSIARALAEARSTIARMPATFTRYPNSDTRVFIAELSTAPRVDSVLTLDGDTLAAFRRIRVPGHIWRAMQRLGAWIEPVLTSEWARMMRNYADAQRRPIVLGHAEAALLWQEPARGTLFARRTVERLFAAGIPVDCVWTGRRLKADAFDIDHCLPWSAWPCADLWNLFPASRRVNQHLKRDRLPSATALAAARPGVLDWWRTAWTEDPVVGARFHREASAALPVGTTADLDEVFSGLEWRRLKLRQDQQVEEWIGLERQTISAATSA